MYTRLQISLLSVLGAALCVATVASAQTVQLQAQHPTPLSAPVVSSPANLEQSPPSAPTVTYENGLLTISAYNSTLSDILQGISNQTGADVEIPPQADERVVTHLGPGPAQDVLRSLLAGSEFNYVIVGSASDPNALVAVLLTPRPPNTNTLSAQNAVQQAELRRNVSDTVAEDLQKQDNPQEAALPVRAQQQMLRQRQQLVMEAFQQNQQTK